MAVWLSMSMSYVGAGDIATMSKVLMTVTVNWNSVSYNGYSPALTVSADGASDTVYVSFNTGKTSSGSETIYSKYWDFGHDSSGSARTVYGSASYASGTASGTITASDSVYLPAIDIGGGDTHDHYYTWEVSTPATCTTAGVMLWSCDCGDSYTESIPATGHSYTSKVTTEATCSTDGVRTYTCSACGYSYTQKIPATGHNYVDGVCTNCGAIDPDLGTARIGDATYAIHIDDGTTWYGYEAHIDNGTSWEPYS